ncbi:MAG: hypothetical protein NC093_10710 [Alistipes sp.]|nr:hypothetical protein [Alistipes sp.]
MAGIIIVILVVCVGAWIIEKIGSNWEVIAGLGIVVALIVLFIKFWIIRLIVIGAILIGVGYFLFTLYQEKLDEKIISEAHEMAKKRQAAYSLAEFKQKYKTAASKEFEYKNSYLKSYCDAVSSEMKDRGKQMAIYHAKAYDLPTFEAEFKFAETAVLTLRALGFNTHYKSFYLEGYISQLFRQTAIFTLDEFVYLNQFYLTNISTGIFELPAKLEMLDKNSVVYKERAETNPFSAEDWTEEDNFTVKLSGSIFDNYKQIIMPYLDESSVIEKTELYDNVILYRDRNAKSGNMITTEITLD